jgi:hypothetical protein
MGVSVRTARRAARDLDRRRAQFNRTMHRADPTDPHKFDMVLDTASLGLEIAVELVVRAVEVGRPASLPAKPAPRPRPDSPTSNLPESASSLGINRAPASAPDGPTSLGTRSD